VTSNRCTRTRGSRLRNRVNPRKAESKPGAANSAMGLAPKCARVSAWPLRRGSHTRRARNENRAAASARHAKTGRRNGARSTHSPAVHGRVVPPRLGKLAHVSETAGRNRHTNLQLQIKNSARRRFAMPGDPTRSTREFRRRRCTISRKYRTSADARLRPAHCSSNGNHRSQRRSSSTPRAYRTSKAPSKFFEANARAASDVQIANVQRVLFDELSARLDLIPHQHTEELVHANRIAHLDL